jgi:peptidoglycan/LPS O-acetylase OafA/YrhL
VIIKYDDIFPIGLCCIILGALFAIPSLYQNGLWLQLALGVLGFIMLILGMAEPSKKDDETLLSESRSFMNYKR